VQQTCVTRTSRVTLKFLLIARSEALLHSACIDPSCLCQPFSGDNYRLLTRASRWADASSDLCSDAGFAEPVVLLQTAHRGDVQVSCRKPCCSGQLGESSCCFSSDHVYRLPKSLACCSYPHIVRSGNPASCRGLLAQRSRMWRRGHGFVCRRLN
jgi:hypothetical protein